MLSLRAEMELAEMKPCAFCAWSSHDFQKDAEHERLHMKGWHTCQLDGGFRHDNPDCRAFAVAQGARASY